MKKSRLDIKIDPALKKQIQRYAQSKGKTVTSLIVDHFHALLEHDAEGAAEPL